MILNGQGNRYSYLFFRYTFRQFVYRYLCSEAMMAPRAAPAIVAFLLPFPNFLPMIPPTPAPINRSVVLVLPYFGLGVVSQVSTTHGWLESTRRDQGIVDYGLLELYILHI